MRIESAPPRPRRHTAFRLIAGIIDWKDEERKRQLILGPFGNCCSGGGAGARNG